MPGALQSRSTFANSCHDLMQKRFFGEQPRDKKFYSILWFLFCRAAWSWWLRCLGGGGGGGGTPTSLGISCLMSAVGGGTPTSLGISCLMSAVALSPGMRQLVCARGNVATDDRL